MFDSEGVREETEMPCVLCVWLSVCVLNESLCVS